MIQVGLGILFILAIVILEKVHSMSKRIERLTVNIPQELSELKHQLAPLFYLPLVSEGNELARLENKVYDEERKGRRYLQHQELLEMERFAQSGSPSEPFLASDSLKEMVNEWAIACNNCGRFNELVKEYKQSLMDVISSKITIKQAQESLSKINFFEMTIDEVDKQKEEAHINELYNYHTKNWQAGKWHDELELLKKYKTTFNE